MASTIVVSMGEATSAGSSFRIFAPMGSRLATVLARTTVRKMAMETVNDSRL